MSSNLENKSRRLLVVDDDDTNRKLVGKALEFEGYRVRLAESGSEAIQVLNEWHPHLVLLDVNMPGLNGLETLAKLRSRDEYVSVMFVSANSRAEDVVRGLDAGADDYVTKPFSIKILLQRIKALQRRVDAGAEPAESVEHLGVRIDRVRHRATYQDRELALTPTEFRLLECLLRQPGRAFSRHQLMDAAIGEGAIVLERTIDVHIKTLRRKLGNLELIETVRGVGYRFRETPVE